jgi:hypothetical protein
MYMSDQLKASMNPKLGLERICAIGDNLRSEFLQRIEIPAASLLTIP